MIIVNNIDICTINLAKIKDIDKFLRVINKYEGDYVLRHNTFEVDAKSIMGIFSLNLEKDLSLIAVKANFSDIEKLTTELKEVDLLQN